MWKRIVQDSRIHQFLFKYAAMILAAGLSLVIGSINTLAPLEDRVYEKYYKYEAEFKIIKNKQSMPTKKSTVTISNEYVIKAEANLKAAKHSKDMINSLASMNQSLFDLCATLFIFMSSLAAGHWLLYKIEAEDVN